MRNARYEPNLKNKGRPVIPRDPRLRYVTAACGKCSECREQKGNSWRVRLAEELKRDGNAVFVTLTFSNESLESFEETEPNEVCKKAIGLFLGRWKKNFHSTPKHWLIPELGHEGTERLHIHGLLWTKETQERTEEIWKYGWIYFGEYTNMKTINYIVKYVTKMDEKHPEFIGKVFATKGLGSSYIQSYDAKNNKYKGRETNELYRLPNGTKTAMPTYLRNKLYSESERENLWLKRMDEMKIWVKGNEIDISTTEGYNQYVKTLSYYQKLDQRNGYPKRQRDKKKYEKKVQKILELSK